MKFTLAALCAFYSVMLYSQQVSSSGELSGPRGYYQHLMALDPHPANQNETSDTLRFIFSRETEKAILALAAHYLADASENDFSVPEPPANSSAQTRAELNYLLNLQQQRSPLDVESSKIIAGISYNVNTKPGDTDYSRCRKNLFHIGRSIGTWYTPENLPLTADLLANVWKDCNFFVWKMKFKYARVRPYTLEPEIQNLEDTDWAAYPSGHASSAYVMAFIVRELAPEFSDDLLRDAYDMTHSREILGVHFPSDGEAGRIFARQLVNKLFQNQRFLAEFELVKNEWREKAHENFTKPALVPSVHDEIPVPAKCATKCE